MKKKFLNLFLVTIFCLLFIQNVYAMHIADGILSMQWVVLWYLLSIPFIVKAIIDIKKKSLINPNFKPVLGMIGAVVFLVSCMPIPIPFTGTCSHPCGTGISAILLGPIISIFITSISLFFQALFLAHGGLTTGGANIASMGIAGSLAGYFVFKISRKFKASLFLSGFMAGLIADWATYTATSLILALSLHGDKSIALLFKTILMAFAPTQIPLGILEGFFTGGIIVFISKRRPDILSSLGVEA